MYNVVGLIPARSGSQRIQNKNIRLLGEHPLIAYTVGAAVQSNIFSAVIVSTDSQEISDIGRYYGAEAPFLRPVEFAGSTSPDIEWIVFTLRNLQEQGRQFDAFSILRPTSPFRQPETIRRAWAQFVNAHGIDSIRAVEKCKNHPGKMWLINKDRMTPLLLNPRGLPWHSTPYQALPEVYIQNASLEIAWSRVALEDDSISGKVIGPFLTQGYEGYDLNDIHDWMLAEQLIHSKMAALPELGLSPYSNH